MVQTVAKLLFIASLYGFSTLLYAQVIDYTLNIAAQPVTFSGKMATGLTINQTIPGPTLKAQVGDTLRITVTNHLETETSLHWHGVIVPNAMDGVPYITTPPILPGATFVYEFPIKHSGTYWYHAHSALQEQQGVYGALVFYPEQKIKNYDEKQVYDEEHVLVLSDWTDESPEQVLSHLKKDADYYALKKGSVQSWWEVLKYSPEAFQIRMRNAWSRMGTMDLSDIGYDAFLINGKTTSRLSQAKPGTRVKLRIINAAASSYFIFEYSGGTMSVIEADGRPLTPFTASKLKLAMAETYDVLITIPEPHTYELRASAEDGTGYATAHIGQGSLLPVPDYPKPHLVLMEMHSMMHHMHTTHEYAALKAAQPTTLPKQNPQQTFCLKLTGSMERYVWTINDTAMYAAPPIMIKKGENVTLTLKNETMMHHPIHLHGHFFRVLNDQGEYSPLKHTVNVPPFETVTVEFEADQEKDWIFHCHNLYHMKLGMGGVLHYAGTQTDPKVLDSHHKHSGEHGDLWFTATTLEGYSNFSNLTAKLMHNNDNFLLYARHDYQQEHELEARYQKYTTPFFGLYGGAKFKKENNRTTNSGLLGVVYTLPLLIKTDLRINTHGKLRWGLSNNHVLTNSVSLTWEWNTDKEYTLGLAYALNKHLEIAGNYDARTQFGAGVNLKW